MAICVNIQTYMSKNIRIRKTIRRKEIVGFGESLKVEREKRKMTREQISNKAFVSVGTLEKIENGVTKNPSITTVIDILKALKFSKDDYGRFFVNEVLKRKESLSVEFNMKAWKNRK